MRNEGGLAGQWPVPKLLICLMLDSERILGNGEVVSSILTNSTTAPASGADFHAVPKTRRYGVRIRPLHAKPRQLRVEAFREAVLDSA